MIILDVWLEAFDQPIGLLVQDDRGDHHFAYRPEWLASPLAHPLSLSMPLREQPYGDVLTRDWFNNLLQENDVQLQQVLQQHGLDRSDLAGILTHVGKDMAGAVSVLPHGSPPVKRPGDLMTDYDVVDDDLFRQVVHSLAKKKPLPDQVRDPSPVAGWRDKMSLAVLPGGTFGLPKAGTGAPTTHILKIPDERHPHEARDEAFVTDLARECGLNVGLTTQHQADGQDYVLIKRFDRVMDGNLIYRRHQEDFAQAAGLPAALKYERKGIEGRRFDAAAIGSILAATASPAMSREAFLKMTLFNLIIGNTDNHAKNHGIIHGLGEEVILAPFYDLVPVQTVAGFHDRLSFNIGNAERAEDVTADDLIQFSEAIGLPRSTARRILNSVARTLIETLEGLTPRFPPEMKPLDDYIGGMAGHIDAILNLGLDIRERDMPITRGGGWQVS